MHSPHSPLHPHSQLRQQNKLSGRYINNKIERNRIRYFNSKNEVEPPTSPKTLGTDIDTSHTLLCGVVKGNRIINFTAKTEVNRIRYFNSKNELEPASSPKKLETDLSTLHNAPHYKHDQSANTLEKNAEPTIANNLHSSSLPRIASKLICNCEKQECFDRQIALQKADTSSAVTVDDNISPSNDKKNLQTFAHTATSNLCGTKRLVATRNAATSPHLDIRRLSNLNTVSSTVPNTRTIHEISQTSDSDTACKSALEKSNSLGDPKPQKQLRTTRSLSPRPPVRHQQAIIVSDENEVVSVKIKPKIMKSNVHSFPAVSNLDNISERKHLRGGKNNSCKSEQTSPNITELSNIKFAYNQMANNKSTGCLVYVPTDPWLKMTDLENFSLSNSYRSSQHKSRKEKYVNSIRSQTISDTERTEGNPWVKRSDSNVILIASKKERFRQVKSFSATKFDVAGSDIKKTLLRPKLRRCKSPLFTDDGLISCDLPLQSAPSSPHYLKTPENPFSSAFSLTSSYNVQKSNSPPRSASFSPARGKDTQNPFADSSSPTRAIPSSSPPSISVAAVLASEQQKSKRSFLDVCNPNLLQARHSFSSISNQDREDELQLNIRRLSEQMRKTHNSLNAAVKISLSDRNVSDGASSSHHSAFSISTMQMGSRGADFSDYLAQFRNSEAKKAEATAAATSKTSFTSEVLPISDTLSGCAAHSTSSSSIVVEKPQQTDSLLETTC